MDNITLLKQTRALTLRATGDLDEAALHKIPETWKNNILWHVGHLVVTQQLLCYKLSGNKMLIEQSYVDGLAKGSGPADWSANPDWQQTKDLLIELPERLETDYDAGLFKEFADYPTSTGICLTSIDDAIAFNNYHEGIHLGFIMALKREIA